MIRTMIIRNKYTGAYICLFSSAYEVGDAFIQPLVCFYKEDYELVSVVECVEEKEK